MRSKILVWYNVFSPYRTYLLIYYLYILTRNLWPIFGLTELNKNVFDSIAYILHRIVFTCSRFSLSYIHKLVLDKKSRVSFTLMWYVLRLPRRCIHVALCLEDKEEMIWRMKIIRYICRVTCSSWIPRLRTSGSNIGWDLGFELGFSVDIVLGAPVGSQLGYSINIFLGLALEIFLAHGKDIWSDFHLVHWMAWWFALEKYHWLDYHWDFHLDSYLTLQILDWLTL